MNMATLDTIAFKIIKEQELVIGPLAWSEAQKVQGIHIDPAKSTVTIDNNDPKNVIDMLVDRYERLFGRASHEVCKEAAAPFLTGMSAGEIPLSLVT